jgi:hypothetical protein
MPLRCCRWLAANLPFQGKPLLDWAPMTDSPASDRGQAADDLLPLLYTEMQLALARMAHLPPGMIVGPAAMEANFGPEDASCARRGESPRSPLRALAKAGPSGRVGIPPGRADVLSRRSLCL